VATTPFAEAEESVTVPRIRRDHLLLLGLLVLVVLVVGACAGAPAVVPGASGSPMNTATPHPPLEPASPGANPMSLLAWLFNPIFQGLFILLVWIETITGDIGLAIIIMTLIVRTGLIPLFRRQIVSTKRMQLIQPELKELQKRYKGDRARFSQAQMELYKERGVNPTSGCLPILLQLPLLLIIYQVISQGLTNPDPTAMLTVFGHQVVDPQCVNGLGTPDYNPYLPCIDTTVTWLGNMDVSKPQVLFTLPLIGGFSILAFISAALQLVQSRMTMPPTDPAYQDQNSKTQRQLVLFLPLISILYGGFLPAGLFIYWIVTTIFGIAQQYLIVGWGSMFPLLGWTPGFARDHRPRFPVEPPSLKTAPPGGTKAGTTTQPRPTARSEADRTASAAATLRPRERGRQGRRGRKR
jgi:YidC/Oxa1 family membrane protein insertase